MGIDWKNTIKDSYSNYERGLARLKEATRSHRAYYTAFLNYENQLNNLIKNARNYPLDDTVQNRINRVVGPLNSFCIAITEEQWSFNDLCNEENIRITIK